MTARVYFQAIELTWAHSCWAFGAGDPTKVTIFGESAGGFSVCWHLVSEASAGLFSAAIMESGSCDSPQFFQPVASAIAFNGVWRQACALLLTQRDRRCPTPQLLASHVACRAVRLRAGLQLHEQRRGAGLHARAADGGRHDHGVQLASAPSRVLDVHHDASLHVREPPLPLQRCRLSPNWPFPAANATDRAAAAKMMMSGLGAPVLPALAPLMPWGPAIDGATTGECGQLHDHDRLSLDLLPCSM